MRSYYPNKHERDSSSDHFIQKIMLAISIMLIITIGGVCIIKLNYLMKMQTDLADQSNYIRQEVECLQSEPIIDDLSYVFLTDKQRDLIERVVASEARGESLEGQMAVAQTILDRAELWNMSVDEVVTAPAQYAEPYNGTISDNTRIAVANVFDQGIRIFSEPITHFYSGDNEPYWTDNKVNRGSIGSHKFYF